MLSMPRIVRPDPVSNGSGFPAGSIRSNH